ncbi:unnamed protein product [Rhizoctonia solani]|uniref:3'-5' exonuclease n=1 Tax=Rhizoctonia solani TaxID=456999 RepID=A0A8H3HWZ5_9AGAM|nr:unnamed protein product [Rhizoctonia solani]
METSGPSRPANWRSDRAHNPSKRTRARGFGNSSSANSSASALPPFLWEEHVAPGAKVKYLRTEEEVNVALKSAKGPFGFDIEWKPSFVKGMPESPIALMQLAGPNQILLIQLTAMRSFPSRLRDVLEDYQVVKAGVGIAGDAKKLWRDYGVSLLGAVELSKLAQVADPSRWATTRSGQLIGLARLVEIYHSHRMLKSMKVKLSNWEQPLDPKQIEYAASDALAGVILYQHLLDLDPGALPQDYTSNYIAGRGEPYARPQAVGLRTGTYALDAQLTPTETERSDPATSIRFPTSLKLDGESKMTLLGLGVRKVSFLGIQVYSVGFYADVNKVDTKTLRQCKSPEECIRLLIQTTSCALRIVPTRATSYTHLRDGFIRTIQARQALGRKDGSLTTEREEALHTPLQQFKGLFPTAAFKKHEPLHIILSSPTLKPRELRLYQLGTVQDDWLATEFFLAYFHGTISPPLIEDVKQNVEAIWLPNMGV